MYFASCLLRWLELFDTWCWMYLFHWKFSNLQLHKKCSISLQKSCQLRVFIIYIEALSSSRSFSVDGANPYTWFQRVKYYTDSMYLHMTLAFKVLWLSCYLNENNLLHPVLKGLLQNLCFVITQEQLRSVSMLVASPSYCKIIHCL